MHKIDGKANGVKEGLACAELCDRVSKIPPGESSIADMLRKRANSRETAALGWGWELCPERAPVAGPRGGCMAGVLGGT